MSLLDSLAPDFKPFAQDLYDLALRAQVRPRITSARRSYAEQEALYQRFLQGRSRYPVAAPGRSAHEYGYAFDLVVDNLTDQRDLGIVWRSWGGVYGGEEDPIHYQAPFTAPSDPETGSTTGPLGPKFGKSGTAAEQLVDILLGALPALRILGIAQLAAAISRVAGGDGSLLQFWVLHPAEFLRDIYDLWWTFVSSF